ncbi:MAG: hypothetical protein FJW80_09375 [Actinobacteria bacterium]|nr:hypothetical protein [Actinomycetota bacterium]
MNFTKKLVSVAAGVALVAGVGMAAAPAATAKTTYSGTTLISFDKKLATVVGGIVAVTPAKKSGTKLTFPVTNVKGTMVYHKGAIKVGAVEVSDPVIVIGANDTASITVTSALGSIELFTIKNFKIRTQSKKQQVWQGFLHLTTNTLVVDTLNSAVGADVFTPDMGLGQIRTTINIKK